jgi:DNA-binding beta-propeller fold protein YncE
MWNYRVEKFTSDGSFITQWGGSAGQFNAPTGIAVDFSGNIYVVDSSNNRIEKFGNVTIIPVEQAALIIAIAAGALAFIILKRPKSQIWHLKRFHYQ